jgi:DNA-binding NarL/FixJ family response regulator
LGISPIRILLVEDYAPYRSFVAALLSGKSGLHIIFEATDGLEAVAKAEELRPDVVLMDLGLPRLNGLEAARRIRKLAPSSRIIFLTQETDVEVVKEALSLGSTAYVAKKQAPAQLLPALAAVLQGKPFVSTGLPSLNGFPSAGRQIKPTDSGPV